MRGDFSDYPLANDDRSIDFDAVGGYRDLEESVRAMPDDFSRLVPVLGDRDADDAFSSLVSFGRLSLFSGGGLPTSFCLW